MDRSNGSYFFSGSLPLPPLPSIPFSWPGDLQWYPITDAVRLCDKACSAFHDLSRAVCRLSGPICWVLYGTPPSNGNGYQSLAVVPVCRLHLCDTDAVCPAGQCGPVLTHLLRSSCLISSSCCRPSDSQQCWVCFATSSITHRGCFQSKLQTQTRSNAPLSVAVLARRAPGFCCCMEPYPRLRRAQAGH